MTASSLRTSLAALAISAALTTLSGPASAQPPTVDRIVGFGTSLSDSGNAFVWLSDPANAACGTRLNVPPYDALDDLAIPDGPYAIGGHHVTNGATWLEGTARGLARAGNARPALASDAPEASNYATSGARAVAGFPCRFNLPDQVATYLADFDTTSGAAIVVIEMGGNDVRDALAAAAGGQNPAPYLGNALSSLADAVIALYSHGARRFLLPNVPDIGKTPAVRTLDQVMPGAAFLAGALAGAYNGGLAQTVQQLSVALPGTDIRILDIHATLDAVVANPAAHGFVNVSDACVSPGTAPFKCATPDDYVFWDGTHPTKAFHAIVAQQALLVISAP